VKRVLFLIFVIFVGVFARENPFTPTNELNTSVASSNVIETLPPFEKQYIKFPSDAREFISVLIKYKSDDGSIKEKLINIDKSVDFKDELVLQKIASPVGVAVRADDISVTKETSKAKVMIASSDENITKINPKLVEENTTTKPEPLKRIVINPLEAPQILKAFDFKDTKFELSASEMKIYSKDEIVKNFAIEKNRIVVDFKGKNSFATKKIQLECGAFENVIFGSHNGFYRMVIKLESKYKYEISKADNGYLLKVRK
jgi:putative periplasmic protein